MNRPEPKISSEPKVVAPAVASALREEFARLLSEGSLTPGKLAQVAQASQAAHSLMMSLDPEATTMSHTGGYGTLGMGVGGVYYGARDETFGSKAMREAVSILRGILDSRRVTDLVDGIAKARAAGLDDVEDKLRAQLDEYLAQAKAVPQEGALPPLNKAPNPSFAVSGPATSTTAPAVVPEEEVTA